MVHDFNVVARGADEEGPVIAGMVMVPDAGHAVVRSPTRQAGLVKSIDLFTVCRVGIC